MPTGVSRRMFLAGAAGISALSGVARTAYGNQLAVNAKFDVDRFVDDVKRAQKETDGQKAIEDVLSRAVSDPQSIIDGIGEPSEAGIHTLYRADDLTIL